MLVCVLVLRQNYGVHNSAIVTVWVKYISVDWMKLMKKIYTLITVLSTVLCRVGMKIVVVFVLQTGVIPIIKLHSLEP